MIVVHAVRSEAFAGVERYIASVAPLLTDRGVDVRVVGGDAEQMCRVAGPSLAHVPADTTSQVARALSRMGRVDLVHVHMTAAELAGVLTARWHRGALVSTRHFCARRGKSILGHAVAPLIRRGLAQQISVSHAVADSIGEPSLVLRNAVANRPAGDAHRRKTVLVLQRLEHEKETDLALRAWSKAAARHQGWTLEIAGDGSLRRELVALTDSLGIVDSVRFLGHVPDPAERLGTAGLLFATAPREPFGLSVVEAMAAGTPVVAAAGGGHLETVGSCARAHLFEPGDVDGSAAQLDALTADDAERATYGEALRSLQRREFDIETHVDELLRLYDRLV